jgi:hypothetical protein
VGGKIRVLLSLTPSQLIEKTFKKKSCPLKPKMNIFVPFFVRPNANPIFVMRVGNVWSWIIERFLMHGQDDAHAFSSDERFFWCVFGPPTLKYV